MPADRSMDRYNAISPTDGRAQLFRWRAICLNEVLVGTSSSCPSCRNHGSFAQRASICARTQFTTEQTHSGQLK
ncbi:hypothetical protein ABH995_000716 [Bradyrhizobium yuanmingense]